MAKPSANAGATRIYVAAGKSVTLSMAASGTPNGGATITSQLWTDESTGVTGFTLSSTSASAPTVTVDSGLPVTKIKTYSLRVTDSTATQSDKVYFQIIGLQVDTTTLPAGGGSVTLGGLDTRTTAIETELARAALGGVLGADVTLTAATLIDVMSTASLGVGKWLLTFDITVLMGASATPADFRVTANTATCTFVGPTSASPRQSATVDTTCSITCLVVVTVAGTVKLQGLSTLGATVKTNTFTAQNWPNATGWTAIPVRA